MVIFDPLTAGTLLVLAGAGNASCQLPKSVEISVIPRTNDVQIDTSQTLAEVQKQQIDTIDPYGYNSLSHTNAYMKGSVGLKSQVQLDYKPYGADGLCIWYDTVKIEIFIDPTIVIGSEVAADKCMYNAVLNHEMKHVRVDREIVNKYAKSIGAKIFDGLKQRGFLVGPVKGEHGQEIADRMKSTVSQLIELEQRKMEIERAERQQAVDSLDEYERVNSECPDFKAPPLRAQN